MPEGFVTLELFLNAEGETLNDFTQETDVRSSLVIPYAIKQ
jgi:hypothetical protein